MSCTVPVALQSHTNCCDAQYSGRKQKTSGRFGLHPTAGAQYVKLTVNVVQYVNVVVQDDSVTAMRQSKRQHPLTAATYSAVIRWRKDTVT